MKKSLKLEFFSTNISMNSLSKKLQSTNEPIFIYYKNNNDLKKIQEEILDFFGESPFEYGKIKFVKYEKS